MNWVFKGSVIFIDMENKPTLCYKTTPIGQCWGWGNI